jgi:hypothetical protein
MDRSKGEKSMVVMVISSVEQYGLARSYEPLTPQASVERLRYVK